MTTRTRWTIPLAAIALLATAAARQGGEVTVRFLANEGVMLSDGARAVLVDALFQPYRSYPVPKPALQASLERASDPFDRVALLLATHHHGDHFHPVPVARHLAANAGATFLAAPQVGDSLASRLAELRVPAARAQAVAVPPGAWRTLTAGGVTVHALGWPHGGERHRGVDHLAWLVEIGGRRVLHAGDADLGSPALARLRLDTARVDLALLPAWMYASAEDRERVRLAIRPARVILIHDETAVDGTTGRAIERLSLDPGRQAR